MSVSVRNVDVITSESRRQLRTASTLVFHLDGMQSYIRCLFERRVNDLLEWDEVRIDCDTKITNYNGANGSRNMGGVRGASCVMSHVQWTPHLLTALDRIRKDDRLKLEWVANNNSNYLDNAGLYQDQLFLTIMKPNGRLETYFIATSVCENNTAKMVKNESTPRSVLGD